jgi:hypothetical protein
MGVSSDGVDASNLRDYALIALGVTVLEIIGALIAD